jgi:hypothetical protein
MPKQVFTFSKVANTNTWTEVTSGNYFWAELESEYDYIQKLGFDYNNFYLDQPNFLAPQHGFKNELFQNLVFTLKADIPPIANPFTSIVYIRIAEKERGVMFLCEKTADVLFLLESIEGATSASFQKHVQ